MVLQWIRSTDPEDDTAPAEPLCSAFTPSDVYRCSMVTALIALITQAHRSLSHLVNGLSILMWLWHFIVRTVHNSEGK